MIFKKNIMSKKVYKPRKRNITYYRVNGVNTNEKAKKILKLSKKRGTKQLKLVI